MFKLVKKDEKSISNKHMLKKGFCPGSSKWILDWVGTIFLGPTPVVLSHCLPDGYPTGNREPSFKSQVGPGTEPEVTFKYLEPNRNRLLRNRSNTIPRGPPKRTIALDRSYYYDVIFKLKFFGNISAGACFRF